MGYVSVSSAIIWKKFLGVIFASRHLIYFCTFVFVVLFLYIIVRFPIPVHPFRIYFIIYNACRCTCENLYKYGWTGRMGAAIQHVASFKKIEARGVFSLNKY